MNLQEQMDLVNGENHFMLYNGMRLTHLEADAATVEMDIVQDSQNLLGVVHGGVYFTMADCAAAAAARTDGRSYVTADSDIHFLRGSSEGRLSARAQVRRRGRRACRVVVSITSEEGLLLCDAGFTMYCTGPFPSKL